MFPGRFRSGVVILLGLLLTIAPAYPALAQTSQEQQQRDEQQREEQAREQQQRDEQQREEQAREQQQRDEQQREEQAREQQQRDEQQREEQAREQQQRDEQQREEQAREQQQREEQQREQQAREQQQREEQQREEQAREQQQRDEQQREEQAREQQQREEQQREQQAREQQQREEQQREEQQRQQQTPAAPVSTVAPAIPAATSPAESHASRQDGKGTAPRVQSSEPGTKIEATAGDKNNAAAKEPDMRLTSDLHREPCDKKPCMKPTPKPVSPDAGAKPTCASGQSIGKNNECVAAAATAAKAAPVLPKPAAVPLACSAGQVWNGSQCAQIGAAQQCLPGQSIASPSCQLACSVASGGAQNYILLLRNARQDKDQACMKDPTGTECQEAQSSYDLRLNEYRNFIAGAPTQCGLPDPISI